MTASNYISIVMISLKQTVTENEFVLYSEKCSIAEKNAVL